MSKGIEIDIDGLTALMGKIDAKSKGLTIEIDKALNTSIADINKLQKAYTPVDTGRLRQGNRFMAAKEMTYLIYNDVDYAPYIEFGTGDAVNIPAGLEEVAAQFKGKKGVKLTRVARPFFFRAFYEKKAELLENIKKILTK
jgi:hypothetical protein